MKRVILFLLAVLVVALALSYFSLFRPYAGYGRGKEVFIEIDRGTGTRAIARQLAREGVIRSEWQFLLTRAIRRNAHLQAGEYRFDKPVSAWEVFDRIARGDVFFYELTVPEGYNMFDIAHTAAGLGITSAEAFLSAARDPAAIRDLAPEAPNLEGYLFPSTYRVTRRTTPEQMCKLMTDAFRRNWTAIRRQGADVHKTVTLASLVEKESAVPSERPQVASVYLNRLRIGMPLQCDPTTIYAALLEDRYRGAIYRSDLDSENPYNTYRHTGLPPGPIANPGLASLKAALDPVESDYLYFVAKGDGSGAHLFSRDLATHAKGVGQYRRGVRNGNGR